MSPDEDTGTRKRLRRQEDRMRRTISLTIRVLLAGFVAYLALLHVRAHYHATPPIPLDAQDMVYIVALLTIAAVLWFAHEILGWLEGVGGVIRARFGGGERR